MEFPQNNTHLIFNIFVQEIVFITIFYFSIGFEQYWPLSSFLCQYNDIYRVCILLDFKIVIIMVFLT